MDLDQISRKLIILLSVLMIIGGLWLGLWSLSRLPIFKEAVLLQTSAENTQQQNSFIADPHNNALANDSSSSLEPDVQPTKKTNSLSGTLGSASAESTPVENEEQDPPPIPPIYIPLDNSVPTELRNRVNRLAVAGFDITTNNSTNSASSSDTVTNADGSEQPVGASLAPAITIDLTPADGTLLYQQFFAAAARFDTIDSQGFQQATLRQLWNSESAAEPDLPTPFTAMGVLSDTLPALITLWGDPADGSIGSGIQTFASVAALSDAVYAQGDLLAFLPFDQLEPRLLVLPIDGQNPAENEFQFVPEKYPFRVSYYLHQGTILEEQRPLIDALLAQLPKTNRDPEHLTVLAMTGVTAMVRITASQMDELGNAWPADVVGPELSAADITHISNEVPFVPGCQTNTSANNLTFCSKPEYMAALDAVGVDVIGLTGNHQNDYGLEDALTSLGIYAEAGLPVYGGGKNKEEAFKPLYLEHNGNRLAFLGANSYGPTFAWATDSGPGSAEFDLAIMSATIRNIKEKDLADLVIVDLQYQETYNVSPIVDQRQNFNALIHAGADIVTGVQSHVPQAVEFTDGNIVLYGLGNLFFDQMWSEQTRDGLIAKHTFYKGRHLSTQLLTTVLHDYGQPHWASPADRERILNRVFGASYWQ